MNVEKLNRIRQAESLIASTNLLQGTDDELQVGEAGDDPAGGAKWLGSLKQKAQQYFDLLPEALETLRRAGAMVKNPLFRFLERECSVLSALLQTVRTDLALVLDVCSGTRKSTNHIKSMAASLHADGVPAHWKKYVVPVSMTAPEWLNDFRGRVEQVQ